jgi:hypothetical protein
MEDFGCNGNILVRAFGPELFETREWPAIQERGSLEEG